MCCRRGDGRAADVEPFRYNLRFELDIGARRFGDLIVAAAGHRLPDVGALLDTSMRH